MLQIYPIFVGYDPREPVAYHVCVNSIIRHATKPVSIIPLALNTLPVDLSHKDGSNQFIYSRFLVPYLMGYTGAALYIDGDMIIRDDITKLFEYYDKTKAVSVVKHDYQTQASEKYLGNKNENYPRKNWSSVVLWNAGHPSHWELTPELVQHSSGAFLHRFQWLRDQDIGSLPTEWNWLATEYSDNPDAKLIHYTLGTPCFPEYTNSDMSEHWHKEYQKTIYYKND